MKEKRGTADLIQNLSQITGAGWKLRTLIEGREKLERAIPRAAMTDLRRLNPKPLTITSNNSRFLESDKFGISVRISLCLLRYRPEEHDAAPKKPGC
jgi:hypothetical protein